MNLWAILPCRARSERLYCKPLQKIGGRPILEHLIDGIRRLGIVDGVALGISEGRENHCFIEFAEEHGLPFVIGPELNVLKRVIDIVDKFDVDTMFRMTTECPFIYHYGAADILAQHVQQEIQFTTISQLPLGTTYELIDCRVLREMAATNDPRYYAALARYIQDNSDLFRIRLVPPREDCRRPELNFAIDHPGQLTYCRLAYDNLAGRGLPVQVADLIKFHDENPLVAALVESIHEDVFAVKPDRTMARLWA